MASVLLYIWVGVTSGTFQIKFKFHPFINSSVSNKKTSFIKNVILPTEYYFSLQLIFVSLVLQYISNEFHGSIFLNFKLGPTTTSSPRRQGHGLHKPDLSHDQIRCYWLAEVRNFTNIMIEYGTHTWNIHISLEILTCFGTALSLLVSKQRLMWMAASKT